MKRIAILLLCLCIFLSGCGLSKQIVSGGNRNQLTRLEKGLTKAEVRAIMGKPYKTELHEGAEYWFYYTAELDAMDIIHGVMTRSEADFTPIGFVNDVVDGWGRRYYNEKRMR